MKSYRKDGFFDLLTSKDESVSPEHIREAHRQCIETRDELGAMSARFREEATRYRKAQSELFREPDVQVKKAKLRSLRDYVYKESHKVLGMDEQGKPEEKGFLKRLIEHPEDPNALEVIGTTFQLFTDMGFYNAAIRLFDQIPAKSTLKSDTDIMVGVANAYNYRAKDISIKEAGEEPHYVPIPEPHKALDMARQLEAQLSATGLEYTHQYLAPKIAGIKARAEILISEENAQLATSRELKKAIRHEGLVKANDLYKNGFSQEQGYHHYTGYNAMLTSALLGKVEEAQALAPQVFISTMRDNGLFSDDPLTVFRTMMAIAVNSEVLNLPQGAQAQNTVERGLAALQNNIVEPWQKHAFLRDSKKLSLSLKEQQANADAPPNPEVTRLIQLLDSTIIPAIGAIGGKTADNKKPKEPEDPRVALLEQHAYAPAANSIIPGAGAGKGVVLGGNLHKGGLIPDLQIATQLDYYAVLPLVSMRLSELESQLGSKKKIFPDAIRNKTLKDLARDDEIGGAHKAGQFYEAIRLLVREIFHTEKYNMENMGGDGHQVFEKTLRNLYAVAGISHEDLSELNTRANPDDKRLFAESPTAANAAHLMALRLGDCRMYKVMAGLFHRIAKAAAQNDVIESLHSGAIPVSEALETARNIRRVQLVNFDLDLYSNVEVDKSGWAARNEKGFFVKNKDGARGYIEPHSVNLLVQRKPSGELENMFLACTFYNGEYRDNNSGEIVKGATYDLRVPLTKEMVTRVDKGVGKPPEFEINLGKNAALGVDTGLRIWDNDLQKPVEASMLVAKASRYSHSHELGKGNTRKLYSGNPSNFAAAAMPSFIDLSIAWKNKIDLQALRISAGIENIRSGPPPVSLPENAKGEDINPPKRAVG